MKSRLFFTILSVLTISALISPVYSADCNQQPITDAAPSSENIAAFLSNALDGGNICGGSFPPNNPLTNIFNASEMFFNVTRSTADGALDFCVSAFQNIISQCVESGVSWGGVWFLNGQFYSIENNVYPENGIVLLGASPTSTVEAGSPTSTSDTIGDGAAFTLTDSGGNPITVPQQTATEIGTFSTSYIASITANTVTTTSLDGSGPTVLPIWFCPACAAVAAGILIIPQAAPVAAGLIPPPPGFPALAIGTDGQATPTGSTAPGNQPTGNPQTQTDDSGDSAASTVDPPQATGTCKFWDDTNSKRDFEMYEVVQIREIVVPHTLFKRVEAVIVAEHPMRAALAAMGGVQNVAGGTDLGLVMTRFPRWADTKAESMEARFVVGLTGKVSTAINEVYSNQHIQIAAEGFFRIRWDFDLVKGVHVNAEFGKGSTRAKIAFVPSTTAENMDPALFQAVIQDTSGFLGYDTRANTDQTLFTPEMRTGVQGVAAAQAALAGMATNLAAFWATGGC